MVLTWTKKIFGWLMSVVAASFRPALPFDLRVDSRVQGIRLRESRSRKQSMITMVSS